jgi:hypothetical protein
MLDATPDSGPTPTSAPDPSMAQLAPRPSRARNRLLLLAGVVVLIAAVFSPNVLRPSVNRPNSGYFGSWSALTSHRQVMTVTSMTAQTWPRVDVRSIDDVSGVQLAGAWMVDESVLADFDDTLDESRYESGRSYIEAAMPSFDAERDALPQSLGRGDTAILIVLWDIDSCDTLDIIPPAPARLESRTIVRTSHTGDLPEIAAPGFDVDTLRQSGACP